MKDLTQRDAMRLKTVSRVVGDPVELSAIESEELLIELEKKMDRAR